MIINNNRRCLWNADEISVWNLTRNAQRVERDASFLFIIVSTIEANNKTREATFQICFLDARKALMIAYSFSLNKDESEVMPALGCTPSFWWCVLRRVNFLHHFSNPSHFSESVSPRKTSRTAVIGFFEKESFATPCPRACKFLSFSKRITPSNSKYLAGRYPLFQNNPESSGRYQYPSLRYR